MGRNNREMPAGQEPLLRKRLLLISGIGFAVLYSLICFLLAPAQTVVEANIAYGTLAYQLLGYLYTVAELAALVLFYTMLALGICRLGMGFASRASLLFFVATAYKYLANMLVSWAFAGAVPSAPLWDLLNALFYVALEAIQLAVVLLILKRLLPGKRDAAETELLLHFERVYDRSDPLMRAALWVSVTVFVSKLIGLPISDLVIMILYGFPKNPETWGNMLLSYGLKALVALVCGLICYAGMVLLLPRLYKACRRE